VISPLLANLYLHWFDKLFYRSGGPAQSVNARLIRYADDIRVYVRKQCQEVDDFLHGTLERWMGLTINQEKSAVVNLREESAVTDFLGYTFRYDRDLKGYPWRYLNMFPSKQAQKRERQAIKRLTASSQCYVPIPDLIHRLNRQMAGWAGYFSIGYPRVALRALNEYAQRRLVIHLRRRSQRPFRPLPGVSWCEQLKLLGLVKL
jgi:RNA-directed DNA polymerase